MLGDIRGPFRSSQLGVGGAPSPGERGQRCCPTSYRARHRMVCLTLSAAPGLRSLAQKAEFFTPTKHTHFPKVFLRVRAEYAVSGYFFFWCRQTYNLSRHLMVIGSSPPCEEKRDFTAPLRCQRGALMSAEVSGKGARPGIRSFLITLQRVLSFSVLHRGCWFIPTAW